MSAYEEYLLIQDFKRSNSATFDGVNYAKVVAPYLYDVSFFGWCKKLVFALFFSTRLSKFDSYDSSTLIYYSCKSKKRADYDYIASAIRHTLANKPDYVETKESFSIFQIWHTLTKIPFTYPATFGYKRNFLHRFATALLIAKYRQTAKVLFPSLLKKKKRLITFCDAQPSDNLITQISAVFHITTFTLQHGQYRLLNELNMSPDAEAYANFVSDYMLCWGEATINEFVQYGYDPKRFIIVGWIKHWSDFLPSASNQTFGVMLNSEHGRESNISLLNVSELIAKTLGLNYIVRLHPWSNCKQYEQYFSDRCISCGHFGFAEYLEKVEFSIAHMTGAVIEMLHYKSPVYLYDDGKLAKVFRVEGLSYSSFDSMIDAIVNDRKNIDIAQKRISSLDKWNNDDSNQKIRIRDAIIKNKII